MIAKVTKWEMISALRNPNYRQAVGTIKDPTQQSCYCYTGLILHLAAARRGAPIQEDATDFFDVSTDEVKVAGFRFLSRRLAEPGITNIPLEALDLETPGPARNAVAKYRRCLNSKERKTLKSIEAWRLNDAGMTFPQFADILEATA